MAEAWVLVPIGAFVMIIAVVWSSMWFRAQKAKYETSGGGDYRRLADEAVRGQRVLLEEMQRMNTTLKEIERLLREV